jgi:TRAP-type C4-dicarboxylate transport system permease small subunit
MERLHKVVNLIGYIGILGTMLILAGNVCTRKFGWPIPGTYSIVTVVAVFVAIPAIIHAQFQGAHVVIDTLKSKFSPIAIEIMETFADICAIGIWGLAGWVGLKYAEQMWAAKEVLDPLRFPVALFRFIWAIGLLLICFVILVERLLKLRRLGKQ